MTKEVVGQQTMGLKEELIDMGVKGKLGRDDIVSVLLVDNESQWIARQTIDEYLDFVSSLDFCSEFRFRMIQHNYNTRRERLDEEMKNATSDEDIKNAMTRFFSCEIKSFELKLFKKKYSRLKSALLLSNLCSGGKHIPPEEECKMRPFRIIESCM